MPRVPRNEHLRDKGRRERERESQDGGGSIKREGRFEVRAKKRKQRIEGLAEGEGGKQTEKGEGKGIDSWAGTSANVLFKAVGVAAAS